MKLINCPLLVWCATFKERTPTAHEVPYPGSTKEPLH